MTGESAVESTEESTGPAGGSTNPFSPREMRRIARAVDRAEEATGLQIAVYMGPVADDPRRQAQAMLAELGHQTVPAVLLLVAPELRRLEIVTSEPGRRRLPDRQAALIAASMAASFAVGDFAGGICIGVAMIAQYAGPPADDWVPGVELPDVLSGYDDPDDGSRRTPAQGAGETRSQR